MIDATAPTAIAPSGAPRCRRRRRPRTRRSGEPDAMDRLPPARSARPPGGWPHPPPDAESDGAELSCCPYRTLISEIIHSSESVELLRILDQDAVAHRFD